MIETYVVQFRTEDEEFIDQIYCVTETEEDAIAVSEEILKLDTVLEAGYEKVDYIPKNTGLKEKGDKDGII